VARRPASRIAVGALEADLPAAGGIQRYSLEVLREMLARDPVVVGFVASPRVAEENGRVRLVGPQTMTRASFSGNLLRLGWHQAALPARLRRERTEVFYSTVPDGMLFPSCPQVVTVHDLIPLRFPGSSPRLQHYFRLVVPRVLRASAAIVAMSDATRRDIEHYYGIGGERVHVVHQGYRRDLFRPAAGDEVERVRARFGLRRYLLAVGEGRPYKNIPGLLRAFARLRDPGLELVLAGRASAREIDLPGLAVALGVGERVRFLGFVPDNDLSPLYAGAEAFVFPSLFEGFGIPPLEAMACGCPVVCSDRASMPEVCGDTAVYVDPSDVASIAAGVERVLSDAALNQRLRRDGPRRAATFSCGSAAERILQVLRSVAGRENRGD
jgi:glycosyltransferase involved in cell wall biosynthesis